MSGAFRIEERMNSSGFIEILVILGMANEHENITVQQISSATEYDEKKVRKLLKWGS